MNQSLVTISLVIPAYDEAIEYYTQTLGFELLEDIDFGTGKRWVVVRPKGGNGASILLAKASSEAQQKAIGNQTGGRVFLFLHTDDFWRDHKAYKERGVHFIEEPRMETYGTVVVFQDKYGNKWDLIQPHERN